MKRTAHAPITARGGRYALHRERLGEWAAAAVTLLAAGLWLLWPSVPTATPHPRRLPEAGAAYVNLISSGSPLALRPDRFAHGAGNDRHIDTLLPLMPRPGEPPIPPPLPYLKLTEPLVSVAARVPLPPSLPPPVAGPATAPAWRLQAPPGPFATVRLSPALDKALLRFDVASVAVTNVAGEATFRIVLDKEGRVAHVLDEESTDAAMARRWRTALLRGAGRTNAAGSVAIEWRAGGG